MEEQEILEKIYKNKKTRKDFIEAFKEQIEACDEVIIGDPTDEYIFDVFKRQGYWSGVKYRISFSEEYGFEYEERRFGK